MQRLKILFLLIALLASFSFGAAWMGATSRPESTQTIDGKKFYVITTPEELAWFADQVNAGNNSINAVLANDIVFGKDTASVNAKYAWTSIGEDSLHAFRGILDGAGYSIYGVYTDSTIKYGGLVGRLDSAGVVRNVNMKRNSINASDYAGGIVGYNGGTVSDCANSGNVSATYSHLYSTNYYSYVGGIVGYNDGGTVSGCTNESSVTASNIYGKDYVGGIVGYNGGTVSDCANEGSVSGESYVGGIVGYNGGTVSDCANEGSVSGESYAGGIVGSNSGTVSGCTNNGSVTADGFGSPAGGIVGENVGTVSGCMNNGSASGSTAGGIVGSNSGTVSDCTNEGGVIASVSSDSYAGGIVGYNDNNGTVSDCTNEGTVSAATTSLYSDSYAGGIVCYNYGTVSGCMNSGSVSGTPATFMDVYVGGIVCYNYGTVSGCMNNGSVTARVSSNSYAGGIVCYNYGTVSDCSNSGGVTASANPESYSMYYSIGGIVGSNSGSEALVKNSYSRTNTLAVDKDCQYSSCNMGGVVGRNMDSAQIINCYYASDVLYDVSTIGENSATLTDVSGMTTANMRRDQFVLILNTTNGSEKNSGVWSRDGGYPIIADVGAASSSSGVANSSSSASSSSGVAGSSSSSGSTALHVAAQPRFNLQVQNRTIWVQNARMGESFAVFDVQGHVLRRGVVNSTELFLSVQNAGTYIVRVGTETMRVRVK